MTVGRDAVTRRSAPCLCYRRALSRIERGSDEFRLAAGVAFVDDFVANAEAAAIDTLAGALGLEKAASQAILRDVHEALFGGN